MNQSNARLPKSIVLSLLLLLLILFSIPAASSQVSDNTVVTAQSSLASITVDTTFTVSITISDVQNLYALDVNLRWNSSVIQALSVDLRLGVETYPDGVLHEIKPNAEIYIAENELSEGQYSLVVTSVNPSPPFSFSGVATIAIITFKAISPGRSELDIESELSDYPQPGQPSNPIEHTDIAGSMESTENQITKPPDTNWLIPIVIALAIVILIIVIAAIVYSRKR